MKTEFPPLIVEIDAPGAPASRARSEARRPARRSLIPGRAGRRRAAAVGVTLGLGIALGLAFARAPEAGQREISRVALLTADLDGMPGKKGYIFQVDIPPGASSASHQHAGHELIYVLEGSPTLEMGPGQAVALKAGDTFYLPANKPHVEGNASASAPARVLVFLIADAGRPLTSAAN